MNEPICRCNSCNQLYIDTNPQSDAPRYELPDDHDLQTLTLQVETDGDLFQGCPECKTDAYLMDIDQEDDDRLKQFKTTKDGIH